MKMKMYLYIDTVQVEISFAQKPHSATIFFEKCSPSLVAFNLLKQQYCTPIMQMTLTFIDEMIAPPSGGREGATLRNFGAGTGTYTISDQNNM